MIFEQNDPLPGLEPINSRYHIYRTVQKVCVQNAHLKMQTSPQSPKPTTKTRPVSFQPEDISAAFFISSRCCSASCRCRPKYAWRVARGGHGFPTQNPPFGMTTWWGYRLSVNHKRFMWGHHPERLGRFTHENPNNLELSCSNLPRYIHVGYSE